MKGILADINIQGHVDLLVTLMQAEPWKLFWDHLQLRYYRFADLGLIPRAADSVVWEACQKDQLILITDNRNDDSPDSLEATIRSRNTPTCLPVLTIANVPHLRASSDYAERVIDKVFDLLMRMDDLLGTGRLFVP